MSLIGVYSIELHAQDINLSRITNEALDHFNLYDGQIVTLNQDVSTVAGGNSSITFSFETQQYTLDLWPHSVRAANYQIVAQVADGSYQNIQPGPERTMRGTVREIKGSVVGASMLNNGLHAMILLPDNKKIWIQPIESADANNADSNGVGATVEGATGVGATGGWPASALTNQHMVYRGEDVVPSQGKCSLHHPPRNDAERSIKFQSDTTAFGTVAGEFLRIAELAIDADFEYYNEEGSTVTNVEDQVTSIINAMNIQFERDVMIRHLITKIIVRTAEEDPYDETDPTKLLIQLQSQWEIFHTNVQRDVVQLFTGKNINGGVIGVAWLGTNSRSTICGSWGYSVVESNCGFSCISFSIKTDLSAHELGHNWGADHCGDEVPPSGDCSPSCIGWTMNCSITGGNKFHPEISIPEIVSYRDTRRCLDEGNELRRISMSSDFGEVEEGGSVQLKVDAVFRFGEDQDVTTETVWSVDPPDAGDVDSNGVFTAAEVNRTTCVTITASYTFDGVTRVNILVIIVMDLDNPLFVVTSDPPDDGIDARIPSALDGTNPMGWQIFDLTLNGDVCGVTDADFMVTVDGGFNTPPAVEPFQGGVRADTVSLTLSNPIEPGAWTTITHIPSGSSIRVGFLPGDVNSDGISNAQDIQFLLDSLAVGGELTPLSSKDIDRSGQVRPHDITSLIDLLNGAESYDLWFDESLP